MGAQLARASCVAAASRPFLQKPSLIQTYPTVLKHLSSFQSSRSVHSAHDLKGSTQLDADDEQMPETLSPLFKGDVSIEEMFQARVHYGHKIGTLKEDMKWALYGERLGVCIFDLDITRRYMIRALNFLAHAVSDGAMVLFVTNNRNQMLPLEKAAASMNQYAHTRVWRHGNITGIRRYYKTTVRLPDVVILLSALTSTLEPHPALVECAKMAIPTISIVDTNADISFVTYPIPGNDDSMASFDYYMKMFRLAIEAGEQHKKQKLEKELNSKSPTKKSSKRQFVCRTW
jgi:small subunit ribosomal protein S2